jgi:histidinol-phosphatase (PHP family)
VMIKADLHVHTTFSDGLNTPEEVVLAAIGMGLERLGFSDHSHTSFDETWCIHRSAIPLYRRTVQGLRDKYADKIDILCGIEQDRYSSELPEGCDYAIGSVHYLKAGDGYLPVDESAEILERGVQNYFGGDFASFAECYFETLSYFAGVPEANIVGHFDLLTKFSEHGEQFDETSPRYIAAWRAAADALIDAGKTFEINTGAISRGYRASPYPRKYIVNYIKSRGGKFILSSDCHRASDLCFQFDRWENWLK